MHVFRRPGSTSAQCALCDRILFAVALLFMAGSLLFIFGPENRFCRFHINKSVSLIAGPPGLWLPYLRAAQWITGGNRLTIDTEPGRKSVAGIGFPVGRGSSFHLIFLLV